MIDSHCHLDFEVFDEDRHAVVDRAKKNGITHIIVPGVTAATFNRVKKICDEFDECLPAYGLHPYFIEEHTEEDLKTLDQWLEKEKPIGVGECGLDFYLKHLDKNKQMDFFIAQVELAEKYDLPVIIHSRKATEDVIKTLKRHPSVTGMVHSYSGSLEQAKQLIDLNFYLSFGGAITYDRATKLRSMIQRLPLDHILLETDAPDQPAMAYQGQRNEPGHITEVITQISELCNMSKNETASYTCSNTKKLFDL